MKAFFAIILLIFSSVLAMPAIPRSSECGEFGSVIERGVLIVHDP